MKDYNYLDDELFDKVEVENTEGKNEQEIKKELKHKRFMKTIKIALYALMGHGVASMTYKPSNAKEKNTNYIDRL